MIFSHNGADVDTMILAVAATQMELDPFLKSAGDANNRWETCITGVGPLETSVRLGRYILNTGRQIDGVIQFGVGGAYIQPEGEEQVPLLSTCVAEREVLGDFGIAFPDKMIYLPEELTGPTVFALNNAFVHQTLAYLKEHGISYRAGTFVTVNSVSGTAGRGEALRREWHGVCENMEGAAVARLCSEFKIPMVEIRVISNLVEDRNIHNWKLPEACNKAGEIVARLLEELS